MKHITSLLLVAVLSATIATVHAAAPKATPFPPKHTVIVSISGDSVTTDTGKTTKSYKINKRTIFLYQGSRVTANDLKPGMRVTVTPAFDGKTAASIAASDVPKKVEAAAKK